MKNNIHPDYYPITVICNCGESFRTGSTMKSSTLKLDVCVHCHPYISGEKALIVSQGQVNKFNQRYKKNNQQNHV